VQGSDKRNSKEIEPKRSSTRALEHSDKKPLHTKSSSKAFSPCLPLIIFPLISEVS